MTCEEKCKVFKKSVTSLHICLLFLISVGALLSKALLSFVFTTLRRTLIQGDKKAGFSVFWADDGLDTGPILLQRQCDVEPNDTVDTLYNRFLFPEGIKAMVTAAV